MRIIPFLMVILTGFLLWFGVGSASAQDGDEADPSDYFGIHDCDDCHRGTAVNHLQTPHANALADDLEAIVADFSSGEDARTIQFPGEDAPRPFTADDVAYVMGSGRNAQAYVYRAADGGYRVFPAQWLTASGEWHVLDSADDWLTSEDFNWATQCAGCHTTGLNVETVQWVDNGVSCESCHGPGREHVEMASELPRVTEPSQIDALLATIIVSPDSQICGQCHNQGMAADGVHKFPVDYLPGETLVSEDYALVAPEDEVHWWASGHAKSTNMQYNEWLLTAHASSLEDMQASEYAEDSCLSCHSGDFRFMENRIVRWEELDYGATLPEPVTLETAQQGIGCISCHNPHAFNEEAEAPPDFLLRDDPALLCVECHTDPDLNDGVHHPARQMFEGASVISVVEPMPSAHFSAEDGPDCATCHMPEIPVQDYRLASHSWEIVPPEQNIEGAEGTCVSCHGDTVDPAALQALLNDAQTSVQARLDAIHVALESDAEEAPDWVEVAVAFVDGDNSRSIHNINYTDKLLEAVEAQIGLTPAQPEPETDVIPNEVASAVTIEEEEAAEETGLAIEAILIMAVASLIMLAGIYAFFRGGSNT